MIKKRLEKYAVGLDFMKLKDIASKMTDEGEKMGISSVRKYLLNGLEKIALELITHYDEELTPLAAKKRAEELAKSEDFQSLIKIQLCDIWLGGWCPEIAQIEEELEEINDEMLGLNKADYDV